MSKLNWWKTACAVGVLCALAVIGAAAQTFTTLANFDGTNGSGAGAPLVQGSDGNLYATTSGGGANNYGTVLQLTPSGTLTTLYSFCSQPNCTDGTAPVGIVLDTDGDFYGQTVYGGNPSCFDGGNGCGTVFRVTSSGALTNLHNFDDTDGADPQATLIQGADGNLYGTTYAGGTGCCGTVFRIDAHGTLTNFYNFCSQSGCSDGSHPSALTLGTDGNFYGATLYGGIVADICPSGCGTIFKITPQGSLTTLYAFCSRANCSDGDYPEAFEAALARGADGNFYGTTGGGGFEQACGIYGCGTIFKITPEGILTTLYSFCRLTGCSDGIYPQQGLIKGTDGNLYGTTSGGGLRKGCGRLGCGTIFKITPEHVLTTLHSFDDADGKIPGGLAEATNGILYGTTLLGGTGNGCNPVGCGTIFSLNVGLSAFVETIPTGGRVGRSVIILGTDLTGATSVTFNGTPATFTVESPTAIKATVPTGANTGPVQVVTPSGTLTSNVPFQVRP
jgi:uncharacterized repeat protein (TIGR03803 family)